MSKNKSKVKYSCVACNFYTYNKKDFTRHNTTTRHLKKVESSRSGIVNDMYIEDGLCVCVCGKEYVHKRSLNAHQKVCSVYIQQLKFDSDKEEEYESEREPEVEFENEQKKETGKLLSKIKNNVVFCDESDDCEETTSSQSELIEHERRKMEYELEIRKIELEEKRLEREQKRDDFMLKQMESMSEIAKQPRTVNNNINNRFNINVFLNDKCKDAMNLLDFVENLQYRLEDLERFGQSGYIEGVSHMLIEGLKDVDVTKRPIHCTDAKRDTLYIKDNDEWKREDANGSKMKRAIRNLSKRNVQNITKWQEENPSYDNVTTSTHEKYIKMCDRVMGGANDEEDEKNYKKIVKKVASEVIISKNDGEVLTIEDNDDNNHD